MDITEIYQIIRNTFDLPDDFIFESNVRPSFIPGWDSLGWMKLISEIENKIKLELPLDIFSELGTVEEFCISVSKYIRQADE